MSPLHRYLLLRLAAKASLARGRWVSAGLLACTLGCQPAATSHPQVPKAQTHAAEATAAEAPDPESWRNELPVAGAVQPINYPATERSQLSSGLSLLVIPRQTATLSLGVTCKSGTAYDPPGQAGISALTARMLTEGTAQLDAEALAVRIEGLGAHLNSGSSEDSIGVSLEVLPESADAAVAILADVLLHPAFRAADLKRIKREWLDNLTLQREDSATVAQLIGRRLLLGKSAGENPLGTASQVARLTSASLTQFHRSAVTPQRCAVSAAGAISTEALRSMAERHFKNWAPSGTPLARREPAWAAHSRVVLFLRPDAVQTSIYLVAAAPSRNMPGHDARRVIDNFFGGLFTSRINLNLREKHAYTYGAASRLNANLFLGTWSIQSDVKSEVTADAVEQVLLERKQLVAGAPITSDEVARAKTDLIHDNAARLSHTNSLLGNLQAEFSQELPSDYFAKLEARIGQLSVTELSAQLPEFNRDTAVLVLVGPKLAAAPKWLGTELETLDASWLP